MNQIEQKFFNELIKTLKADKFGIKNKMYEIRDYSLEDEFSFSIVSYDNDDVYVQITIELKPDKNDFNGYIPDFVINMNGAEQGYVIEIDGHEWHEKTKEQAMNDRKKDRAYIKKGYFPVRFTGYEVYHNPDACVFELLEMIVNNSQFFEYDRLEIDAKEQRRCAEWEMQRSFDLINCYRTERAINFTDGLYTIRKNVLEMAKKARIVK